MRQARSFFGIIAFALLGLSTSQTLQATGPAEAGVNHDAAVDRFAFDNSVPIKLTLNAPENLSFGAVSESSDENAEADKLAKQLSNPVASLISVPFQANEDWGYGPSGNGYKFTLNIQPVIPISISKNWNLILRTIVLLPSPRLRSASR